MSNTLKVGHAPGCAVYGHAVKPAGFTAGDSCSGSPVCDFQQAQELAAQVRYLEESTCLQAGHRVVQIQEHETLRRLAGAYLKATMIADDPRLDLTNAMHAQETVMDARQDLAAHLEGKP